MKPILPLILGCALLGTTLKAQQTDALLDTLTSNINIEGLETKFDPNTGIATATGDVHIVYEDLEIRAGRADYNATTGDIMAKENVTLVKRGEVFRGQNITYNIKTEELTANNIRSYLEPIFYETESFDTNTGELTRIDGASSYFTTHDSATPMFKVKAKSITIYPEDKVVMRNVKVYAGNTPVLWLPIFSQPLDDELGYFFQPGYTSQWGAFLLNQYGVMHGDHTLAKYQVDLRSERGVAGGVDLYSEKWRDNPNLGHLKLYYGYDLNPEEGVNNSLRSLERVDENRYRVAFQHRIYIPGPEESTWYLDFDFTKLSDEFMLEDFFLNDYRTDPQPDNTVKLVKRSDHFTATLLGRFQVNEFYRTDERLPELAFDFTRSRLFNTPVFYQGETSLGMYSDRLADITRDAIRDNILAQEAFVKQAFNSDGSLVETEGELVRPRIRQTFNSSEISRAAVTAAQAEAAGATRIPARDVIEAELELLRAELNESEYFRAHSYHEFLYPMSFGSGNWINFVPRLGGGATYYNDIQGGLADGGNDTKPIFHIGFDFSLKFSRVWDDYKNRTLGIDGLRHVVQPYLNYSYVDADEIENLRPIDRLTPSTRPRPLDLPQFTAIDDIRSWNIARVGVRNLLQTRREDSPGNFGTYNYAGLNTYVDVFMEDPEFDRDISNLYNDLFWNPLPWLSFNINSQLPIGDSEFNFTELNSYITWLPTRNFSWSIGHQLLTDNPLFIDSSLITSSVYARINNNWGFSMNHIYEMDDSTLEYQSYSVHRDLAAWKMAVGGLIRESRQGDAEVGVIVSFTLKEFPQLSIPLDLDPNPTGRGGRE
jgi:LPS-assembly protein